MKVEKFRSLYNDLYQAGYHNGNTCHTKDIIQRYVLKQLTKGMSVIDVGCSTGNALNILKVVGYEPTGVDISEVAVGKCLERGLDAHVGSACDIKSKDNMFDGLTCTDVLEHVPGEMIDKALIEFSRVVKHDGLLFLKIAKLKEFNRRFHDIVHNHGFEDLHVTCWPVEKWVDRFNEWEFKTIHFNDRKCDFDIVLQNKISTQKLYYFLNR